MKSQNISASKYIKVQKIGRNSEIIDELTRTELMFIDLHLHTLHSDGILQVKDTINIAHEKCIKMLSVTDHDSIAGVDEAINYSKDLAINCISGVEFSCRNEMTDVVFPQDISVHILAYNIDYNNVELFNKLSQYHTNRKQVLDELIHDLNGNGFDINYEDIRIISRNQMKIQDVVNHIGTCFMCNVKKEKGVKISRSYYPILFSQYSSLQKALKLIKNAGGLSVLAHAFFSYKDYDFVENSFLNVSNLLDYLCDLGLDGVEAFYPKYTNEQSSFLIKEAKKRNLFITAGSDFHGTTTQRGEMMDYDIDQMGKTVSLLNSIKRY